MGAACPGSHATRSIADERSVHLTFSERSILVRDFYKVHEWKLRSGVDNVVYTAQCKHGRPINPEVEGISVSLRYRTDNNDGKPARTFRLMGIGTYKKSE